MQPEGRQWTLAANLFDLQRVSGSHRGALPTLGTNLGQKSIFSLRFRANPSQPFSQLFCRLARLTLGECVRAIFSLASVAVPESPLSLPLRQRILLTPHKKYLACRIAGISVLFDEQQGLFRTGMSQDCTTRVNAPGASSSALQDLSDEQIMVEVQRGDGDAFTALFDRYHRLVLVTALKIVRDVGEAQEVTQSVFFEIYRAARRFDPARGSLKVWLLQYAYHRSINRRNYLLLRQFYQRPDLDEASAWEASAKTSPQMPVHELKRLIEQALDTLNEQQRRTIQRVIFEGLTLKEVAEQTRESLSNVRNHYYRGLDRLRICLGPRPAALCTKQMLHAGELSHGKA